MDQLVILRHTKDEWGSRYLQATINNDGDVVLEGQDLGKGVEAFWGDGLTEYEFTITIQAADVPTLQKALENPSDVLFALQQQFNSQNNLQPGAFLDAHHIPYTLWSRVGD